MRISSQLIATQLARELGRPLTATSANPSGKQAASTIEQAENYFTGEIEIFLDGGKLPAKIGSSVVEVIEGRIKIIREGEISVDATGGDHRQKKHFTLNPRLARNGVPTVARLPQLSLCGLNGTSRRLRLFRLHDARNLLTVFSFIVAYIPVFQEKRAEARPAAPRRPSHTRRSCWSRGIQRDPDSPSY